MSPGEDNIPVELLKEGGDNADVYYIYSIYIIIHVWIHSTRSFATRYRDGIIDHESEEFKICIANYLQLHATKRR